MVSSAGVYAAPAVTNTNTKNCGMAYEKCYAQCRQEHSAQTLKGDAARATCGSGCVAIRTICLAGEDFDKARPWVTDKIEMFNDFLDNFLKPPSVAPEIQKKDSIKNI